MFTERIPCQNDSAVAQNQEENSLRDRGTDQGAALSTNQSQGLEEDLKASVQEEKLVNFDRVNPGSCDLVSSQRKSTRISQGGRVLRNHRYRRMFDESRHTKRLFTPEIKKYLKDWLIRRRDHPYPNRDEKKSLAIQTGLTYIQICNWFANWRRKLKNAGSEDQRTWSHLIKSYNTQAEGNVEHFSICSDDSIWDGKELVDSGDLEDDYSDGEETVGAAVTVPSAMDHCYSVIYHGIKTMVCSSREMFNSVAIPAPLPSIEAAAQCYMVSSTTTEDEESHVIYGKDSSSSSAVSSHKRKKMETRTKRRAAEMKNKTAKAGKMANFTAHEKETSKTLSLMKRKHSGQKAPAVNGTREKNRVSLEGKEPLIPKLSSDGSASAFSRPSPNINLAKPARPSQPLFSKWMTSAANFQPSTSYVPWNKAKKKMTLMPKKSTPAERPGQSESVPATNKDYWIAQGHLPEELDAAEALTYLGGYHKNSQAAN